ncbi:transcription factor daughterless isoform X4 [Oratosquilla oratoria]|uniref:transcription factor daughterless isoform X4 n=1 Tax=Oratosquilla oratoria TaxID=337810 RepID=UPI003F75A923
MQPVVVVNGYSPSLDGAKLLSPPSHSSPPQPSTTSAASTTMPGLLGSGGASSGGLQSPPVLHASQQLPQQQAVATSVSGANRFSGSTQVTLMSNGSMMTRTMHMAPNTAISGSTRPPHTRLHNTVAPYWTGHSRSTPGVDIENESQGLLSPAARQMYGTDEFNQDSPRYTSPKPGGHYADHYFMEGGGGGSEIWGGAGGTGGAVGGPYSSYSSMMAPHLQSPYSMGHLQDPMAYDMSGLPPMSTIRPVSGVGASSTTGAGSAPTSSPLYTHSPVPNPTQSTHTAQTGDTLGKALASIYPTDQTSSSYSSNPGTPVSATSPPPLAPGASGGMPQQWQPAPNTPTSPHYDRSLPMPSMPEEKLASAIGYLRNQSIEGSRIDERLDDAVHVLQRHAETSAAAGGAGHPHLPPGSLPPYTALDNPHHLGGPTGPTFTALGPHPHDIKTLPGPGLPESKDKVEIKSEEHSSLPTTTVGSTTVPTSTKGAKRSRRECHPAIRTMLSSSSFDEDESIDPETKAVREKERRMANNARERVRVRDINEAFKELGRMCMIHCKAEKAQTKLNILHMAVEVITSLEQQVRERNLNPKAACLKRREEEKSDGPKLPPHHLPHPSSVPPPFPNLPGDPHLGGHGGPGPQ